MSEFVEADFEELDGGKRSAPLTAAAPAALARAALGAPSARAAARRDLQSKRLNAVLANPAVRHLLIHYFALRTIKLTT